MHSFRIGCAIALLVSLVAASTNAVPATAAAAAAADAATSAPGTPAQHPGGAGGAGPASPLTDYVLDQLAALSSLTLAEQRSLLATACLQTECLPDPALVAAKAHRAYVLERAEVQAGATDPYATLGLSRSASARDVKLAFYRQSLILHPDKQTVPDLAVPAQAAFADLSTAYGILNNEEKRRAFDTTGQVPDDEEEGSAANEDEKRSSPDVWEQDEEEAIVVDIVSQCELLWQTDFKNKKNKEVKDKQSKDKGKNKPKSKKDKKKTEL